MSKSFEDGKSEIAKLCHYFATNKQSFLSPRVKEADVCQSLVEPLFDALGWDVRNTQRVAPQYREVIPQDNVDDQGDRKSPDYAFRVGPVPKFFAEAKKCGVNIETDPGPAYQLRNYGWNAKVAVSILTDFEELGVYDCTSRPRPTEKASQSRIQFFRCEEYPDRWRELWDVFSREAVWSGAFDQYAASKRKKGTSEVDVAFLKDIEEWRRALASNIALRNKDLALDDLSAAVQKTIDRIVFLRMAEDRGLEPDEQLLKLCERPDIYTRFMRDLCRKADEKYNSGLFHFQKEANVAEAPDRITPGLVVDDKVMKPIIQSLYFGHGSPYNFKVMPVEILGTVYERFLGKVIRLTAGHQARIEEKPEVRKAGGVYYTPAYIVDYIVRETVGWQTEGRSPAQLAGGKGKPPLRVLDMACGSGSFLLGAYQFLLDHCLKWYLDHKPETHKKAVYKDPRSGEWRLTIEEKKRILTTHVFGVDIDPQAVEVSKLSLLLKALEDENDATLSMQFKLFHDRALPNLAENIKCGNSLVSHDYFTGRLLPDAEEIKRVNPFDWEKGFPDAMKAGGFDCVIGNPPYLNAIEERTRFAEMQIAYVRSKFNSARGAFDSSVVFQEVGIRLLRDQGRSSLIVPNKFLSAPFGRAIREYVAHNCDLTLLADYARADVFKGVGIYPVVYVVQKTRPERECSVRVERFLASHGTPVNVLSEEVIVELRSLETWNLLFSSGNTLIDKLEKQFPTIGDLYDVYASAAADEAYRIKKCICDSPVRVPAFRFVTSGLIDRYSNLHGSKKARYLKTDYKSPMLPAKCKELSPRRLEQYQSEKIIVAGMTKRLEAIWDDGNIAGSIPTVQIIASEKSPHSLKYLLAIVNSRLIDWTYCQYFGALSLAGGYLRIGVPQISRLPIASDDVLNKKTKTCGDHLVKLVDAMMLLHKQLSAAKSNAEKNIIQHQIDATDAEIDRLVYELYGLTDDEIALVEGRVEK